MSSALDTTWVLGLHVLKSHEGIKYDTKHVELHPNFNNNTFYDDFDMALVTVKKDIKFNRIISPICLPPVDEYKKLFGKLVTVAGW